MGLSFMEKDFNYLGLFSVYLIKNLLVDALIHESCIRYCNNDWVYYIAKVTPMTKCRTHTLDTILHKICICLSCVLFSWGCDIGIRGVAFEWFEAYLKHRTQTVQIGSCISTPVTLKYGVPQGSVLGLIYYVHDPSWEYYWKTRVDLSYLRGRYLVVHFRFIPLEPFPYDR